MLIVEAIVGLGGRTQEPPTVYLNLGIREQRFIPNEMAQVCNGKMNGFNVTHETAGGGFIP